MSGYLVLSLPEGNLDVATVAHAVASVSKTLQFKGSCLYFPARDAGFEKVMLSLDTGDATESETDWFLRHLAGYLDADITDADGESIFADSEDNSLAFLDLLPPPEDEFLPIRLFFAIDGFEGEDISSKIVSFFTSSEYDVTVESDGFSVYLAFCAFLDIFYLAGDRRLTGEIDCNCAGAGVYAEVVEIAENLVEALGGRLEFTENPNVSYAEDKDFDKLRRDFYAPIRQQFSFAVNDNRDGLQAYLCWPVDGYEPKMIPGSVVTPLGRYDIDRLFAEIKRYGFSYVCDHRFLSRNTPRDSADFYIKEGLSVIWNSSFGGKSDNFHLSDFVGMNQCAEAFENAITTDKYAKFPKEIYKWLTLNTRRHELDFSEAADYSFHFPPGYLQDEIYYGFGHYLRRFKLMGGLCREERIHGGDVFLFGDNKNGFRLECEMSYGCTGDEVSPLGNNFAHGDTDDIEIFDIGSGSLVRFLDGGFESGYYRAEAEIYILDEIYRFAAASESYDDIVSFRETVKMAVNVEDWYDEVIREESVDPHANGATFCPNIVMPPCHVFERPFPSVPERFIRPMGDAFKRFPTIDEMNRAARESAEAIIDQIIKDMTKDENEE